MARCPLGRTGWCGPCYELARCRRFSHSRVLAPSHWSPTVKRPPSGSQPGAPAPLIHGVVEQRYPDLAKFLTDDQWDDGSFRVLPTMMLFVQDGVWRLWLNDKALSLSAWVTGLDIDAVLMQADQGLASSTLSWRRPKGRSSPPGRRS